jgi:hypothetical protein
MRLVRNVSEDGRCKYAIIDNRTGAVTEARVGDREEFFVIKLKDEFSQAALMAYADAAEEWDPEYAAEVRVMAERSGPGHPNCKRPD